jgi:hypothetical protein
MLVALSAGAIVAACKVKNADEDDSGSGATGGSTSNTGTGTGTGTGSGTTTGTGTGTTTTTPTCDTGAAGDYNNGDPDATCLSCVQCTIAGACSAEWAGCQEGSGQPCDLLFACGDQCEVTCDDVANGGNGNGMIDMGNMVEEDCNSNCWSGFAQCELDCDSVAMGGNANGMIDAGAEETCMDGCTGGPGTCIGDNDAGVMAYIGALSCSVCANCPNNCNAAMYCM